MMGEPFEAGAFQLASNWPFPTVRLGAVGAFGTPRGDATIVAEAPNPATFSALTEIV